MTAAKRKTGADGLPDTPEEFQAVMDAFTGVSGVNCSAGWAKGNLVLKTHGSIFAMLAQGHLVVKLPKARVDLLVEDRMGTRFDPRRTGSGMKEWCEIQVGVGNWLELANEAFDFVAKPQR
jgi:hypothetical protein